MLNISAATASYLEAVLKLNSQSSKATPLRLSRRKSWKSPPLWEGTGAAGDMHMLLLAVEESVVRVLRTKVNVIHTMTTMSNRDSNSLPRSLAAELQRISSR